MPRITIKIDAAVLADLKRLQKREGKSLGQLISELVAAALAGKRAQHQPFIWKARPMRARVDLEDKDAVAPALGPR